jgi:hypothetical protein
MPQATTTNPYAPPASATPPPDNAAPRRIVGGWERRRLLYNVILLFPGIWILALLLWQGLHFFLLVFMALSVAAAANACFCLGPLAELYAAAITHSSELPRLRRLLFWAGTALSLIPFLIFLGMLAFAAAASAFST